MIISVASFFISFTVIPVLGNSTANDSTEALPPVSTLSNELG